MEEELDNNLTQFIMNYIDYAVPKMDVYEQVTYMYIYRHSRLLGNEITTIGFKSKLKDFALGLSNRGRVIAESVIYSRLKSLQDKGFIKIIGTKNTGTEIQLFLLNEVANLIQRKVDTNTINIDEIDFFLSPYRELIIARENNKCFYCYTNLTEGSHVIEHVVSRPQGNNSYKNLVLSCRSCNNRKGNIDVNDFLRTLLRENRISESEFSSRINELEKLKDGELLPDLSILADNSPEMYR